MGRRFGVILGMFICGFILAGNVQAQTQWLISDGGNGHYYEVYRFDNPISWSGAKTAAGRLDYFGLSGYLASVTSEEENDFIADLFVEDDWVYNNQNGFMGPWIGGLQDGEGHWTWDNGDAWTYSGWANNQPSDQAGQDYVHYYVRLGSSGDPLLEPATWNDYADIGADDDGLVYGYVAEFDPVTSGGTVPEPATMVLFGSGLVGMALRKRKRS